MLSTLPTAVERLRCESGWHRVAILVSLLGAGLDGWLSPAMIPDSATTGELNPLSLYHVTGPVTFSLVRVGLIGLAIGLIALAVFEQDRSVWSDIPIATLAIANAANGALAAGSAVGALWMGQVYPAALAASSIVGLFAAVGMVCAIEAGGRIDASTSWWESIPAHSNPMPIAPIRKIRVAIDWDTGLSVFLVLLIVASLPAMTIDPSGQGIASAQNGSQVSSYEEGWEGYSTDDDVLNDYDIVTETSGASWQLDQTENASGENSLYLSATSDGEIDVQSQDHTYLSEGGTIEVNYSVKANVGSNVGSDTGISLVDSEGNTFLRARYINTQNGGWELSGSYVESVGGNADAQGQDLTWTNVSLSIDGSGNATLEVDGSTRLETSTVDGYGGDDAYIKYRSNEHPDTSSSVEAWYDDISVATESARTVQLVDQSGDPVRQPNVTVKHYGANTDAFEGSAAEAESKAQELLDNVSNPWPGDFHPHKYSLQENYQEATTEYVAVNSEEEWALDSTGYAHAGDVDLQRHEPVFEDNAVVVSIWEAESRWSFTGHPVDSELPGSTTSGTVTFEQLSATGEVMDTTTVETRTIVTTYGVGSKDHEAAVTQLPDGVYRISAEGSAYSTVIAVGDVTELGSQFAEDLRDEAGQLTERAERIRGYIEDGKISPGTVTTDANGTAAVSISPAVSEAVITAHKGPVEYIDGVDDPSNVKVSDLREARESGYNGSFVTGGARVDMDSGTSGDTIEVPVTTTDAAPFGDIDRFQRLQEWLTDLAMEDLDQLPPGWEQDLEDLSEQQLRDLYSELADTVRAIPLAEERYEARHGQPIPNVEDLDTRQELQQEIVNLATILEALPSDSTEIPEDPRIEDGTLSMEIPVEGTIDEDATSVMLHWSDGSPPEPMAEEYWSVESSSGINPFGGDTLVIDEYPIEEEADGRPLADVRPNIVTEDDNGDTGLTRPSIPVENPAFEGAVPDLDAWDLSKMRPGPDEKVSVRLRSRDTAFGGLENVTAYDASGRELETTRDGQQAWFTTSGEGPHTIRASYTDSSGATFVDSIRVRALEQDAGEPPTVRWERGVGSEVAIAGHGLQSARIDRSGDEVSFTVVQDSGDTPIGNLHVHGEEEVTGGETVELSVLHPDDSNVRGNVAVNLHTTIGADTLLWKNDEPIVHAGETRHGDVREIVGEEGDRPKRVIRTSTNTRGQLTLETIDDPGVFDRVDHWMATWRIGFGGLASLGTWTLAIGIPAWRRRTTA